jgi:hypothetical protein
MFSLTMSVSPNMTQYFVYNVWYRRASGLAKRHWALFAATTQAEDAVGKVFQIVADGQGLGGYTVSVRHAQLVGQHGSSSYEGRAHLGVINAAAYADMEDHAETAKILVDAANEERAGSSECQGCIRILVEMLIDGEVLPESAKYVLDQCPR